ncbi:MAG: hypothetical protein ACJ74Q_15665 [Pyrinomonadaceae bacterium]
MNRIRQVFGKVVRSDAFAVVAIIALVLVMVEYVVPAYRTSCARDDAARIARVPERDFRLSEATLNFWDGTLDIPTGAGDVVRLPFTHPYSHKLFKMLDDGQTLPATERVKLAHTDVAQFEPALKDDRADEGRYGTWLAVEPL